MTRSFNGYPLMTRLGRGGPLTRNSNTNLKIKNTDWNLGKNNNMGHYISEYAWGHGKTSVSSFIEYLENYSGIAYPLPSFF